VAHHRDDLTCRVSDCGGSGRRQRARLVLFEGGGHRPDIRDPVRFSRLVRQFVPTTASVAAPVRTWTQASHRRPRALYLSSPSVVGDGLEVTGFVPGLHRYLAACDLAVVQGGLTTARELTAAGRPFLYFPLARHFEQQFHVPHRLGRYGAGRRMEYASTDREQLADAIVEEIGRPVSYRPVETDGASRAAGWSPTSSEVPSEPGLQSEA
jgi:hypothetical protein